MKNIFIISQNSFKELIRNRVLYAFIFFAVFLVLLMLALGQLSYTEQYRLSVSLGLASIHLCLIGLTVFIGGSIVYREIDRLTILTVLVRPMSRAEFLIGKYFGFLQLIAVFNLGFFTLYAASLMFMGFDFQLVNVLLVFLGFLLEIMIILSVTLLFSTFSASFLTIIFTICFFLIGHWSEALMELISMSTRKDEYALIIKAVHRVLPNLEIFNWRLQPIEPFLTFPYVFQAICIALAWTTFFLFASSLIFRKRDFA